MGQVRQRDVPLHESGALKVSQTSYDYTRPYWDQIGAAIVSRHVFDMTHGWDGIPSGRLRWVPRTCGGAGSQPVLIVPIEKFVQLGCEDVR